MNAGVISAGSPNQKGNRSGSPIPALATSRICEAPKDWTAARAVGVRTGERIEDVRKRPLYCADAHHGKTLRNTMAMTLRGVVVVAVNLGAIIACGGLGGIAGYGPVHTPGL